MQTQDGPRPGGAGADSTSTNTHRQHSNAVSWWTVHQWVAPFVERAGSFPMLGTPAWNQLRDDDPRKLAAVLDAAQHWALRVDTCQDAVAEASRAVAAAEDWPAVAQRLTAGRSDAYIERRAS